MKHKGNYNINILYIIIEIMTALWYKKELIVVQI